MEQAFNGSNPKNHDDTFPGDLPESERLKLGKYILESNQQKTNKYLEDHFDDLEYVISFPVRNEPNSKCEHRKTVESIHIIEDACTKDTLIEMTEIPSDVPLVVNVQMNILHLALCTEYEGIDSLLSKMSEKMSTRELECMEEEIKTLHTPSTSDRKMHFREVGIASHAVSTMRSRALSRRCSSSSLKEAKYIDYSFHNA